MTRSTCAITVSPLTLPYVPTEFLWGFCYFRLRRFSSPQMSINSVSKGIPSQCQQTALKQAKNICLRRSRLKKPITPLCSSTKLHSRKSKKPWKNTTFLRTSPEKRQHFSRNFVRKSRKSAHSGDGFSMRNLSLTFHKTIRINRKCAYVIHLQRCEYVRIPMTRFIYLTSF